MVLQFYHLISTNRALGIKSVLSQSMRKQVKEMFGTYMINFASNPKNVDIEFFFIDDNIFTMGRVTSRIH